MLRRRQSKREFEDSLYDTLLDGAAQLIESGVDPDAALDVARDAYAKSLDHMAPVITRSLVKRAPRMLRRERGDARRFERHLRRHWGEALDLYRTAAVCAEEMGHEYDREHWQQAAGSGDALFEALTGLFARSCRTALEVHHLLSGGFGMGALARCRTLHELAVFSTVLADYGRRAEHADLGTRFLHHHAVLNWYDAKIYQEHCELLGEDAFSDEELREMKQERDALVATYGADYASDCGWASGLGGLVRPRFSDLERLADLSHLRSYYRWAGHEVHADAKGSALNVHERGGIPYRATGPSDDGLADPGALALGSLMQSLVALVFSREDHEDHSPQDLLMVMSLQLLVDEAGEAFLRGHRAVEAASGR